MIIRRYLKDQDYETVRSWVSEWNIPPPTQGMLPEIGFIIDQVAVGFLEQPDTDSCYFENLYSNPKASKDEREKAIDLIYDAAVECAKSLGFKRMLSTTDHPSIIKRAYLRAYKVEINKVLIINEL